MEHEPTIRIKHPTRFLIAGPTGCGKTKFVARILETGKMLDPKPTRIVWIYSEWQDLYETLSKNMKIEFKKNGLDNALYESFSPLVANLIILDDQMNSSPKERKQMLQIFTQGSHHRNLSVIYIVQNLFEQGANSRTISLNSQYIVLFKNPRDSAQISYLAKEIYPKNSRFLVDSYIDATRKPHSYIFINLTQECNDWMRVCTNIFPGEDTEVYTHSDSTIPNEIVYKSTSI